MPHKHIEGYPSVTQILDVINKPFLLKWYGKNGTEHCEKIKKTSQKFGRQVHTEIERLFQGQQPKYKNQSIKTMVSNFNDRFIKSFNVKAICIEPSEPLIDMENKYSGTFDAIVTIYNDNKLTIADWKTSNQIDNTYWPLQLAAYANLWNLSQQHDKWINEGFIVRLDKKTLDIEGPIWYTELDQYFEVFLSVKRLYDYINKLGIWEKNL